MGTKKLKTLAIAGSFAACITVSLMADRWVSLSNLEVQERAFNRRANEAGHLLQRTLDHHQDTIESVAALLSLKQGSAAWYYALGRFEFQEIVKAPLSRGYGLQALCWMPSLPDESDDVALLEDNARKRKSRVSYRADMFPAIYIEPAADAHDDTTPEFLARPEMKAVMAKSRDSGETAVSLPFRLVQESDKQPDLVLVKPVYTHGKPCETEASRRSNLLGFVFSCIDVSTLLESSMGLLDEHTKIALFSGREPIPLLLLTHQDSEPFGSAEIEKVLSNSYARNTVNLPGKVWSLLYYPEHGTLLASGQNPNPAVLGLGLLFGLVLSGYMGVTLSRRKIVPPQPEQHDQRNDLEQMVEMLQRENEERLVALSKTESLYYAIEQSPFAVMMADTTGQIQYMNSQAGVLTGQTMETFAGQDFRPLCWGSGQAPEQAEEILSDVSSGKKWKGQVSRADAQGRRRMLNIIVHPVIGIDGSVLNVLILLEDVTGQEVLKTQFEQNQKMRIIGTLTGGVAHSFNNLLSEIIGIGEILAAELPKKEKGRDYAHQIVAAGYNAAALTQQLMTIARRHETFVESFDLNEIIEDSLILLREAVGPNIQLNVRTSSQPQPVKADRVQISQLIMNLCLNARDAMPNGGTIGIGTRAVELSEGQTPKGYKAAPGTYIMLSVLDTGTGIPEDVLPHIFESFYTTKEADKNTGLGLTTVSGIVHDLDGCIDVWSEEGQGTEFRIMLPQVEHKAPCKAVPVAGVSEQPAKVMFVEDDDVIRTLTVQFLEQIGFSAIAMSTPKEALDFIHRDEETIDLLLSDVVMPEKTGPEMVAELRRMGFDKPVVFTSGYAGPDDAESIGVPADAAFLNKPFGVAKLKEAVEQALMVN